MKLLFSTAALAAGLALAQAASAGIVLQDNFNAGTPGGNWAGDSIFSSPSSYPGYAGSNANASTDLVGGAFYGSLCNPGQGNCVDLDGSTGNGNNPAGVLESIASFAAHTYTLTFDLAGNQRGAPSQTTDIYLGSQLVGAITLASGDPWATHTLTFTGSGNLAFVEVGPSDNQGNVLDNVTLSAVPEPAAWALMLAGFAGLGAAMRRRRVALV
ncbi:MAG TPA: PEPxxWA-CTERM sorting domain-containing protein [Caulobacteraceae bacterium]|jgi:hypothetical protein